MPIVRIASDAMFASDSAAVQPAAVPLLERIGAGLKDESGTLRVRRIPTTNRSAACSSLQTSNFRRHAPRPRARSSRAASATPGA